jgi:hypothetical protein
MEIKTAKDIRRYHKRHSVCAKPCIGCGRDIDDMTIYRYRGFVGATDSVVCPDCGEEYFGYYLIVDNDGETAVWPFDIRRPKYLSANGEWVY